MATGDDALTYLAARITAEPSEHGAQFVGARRYRAVLISRSRWTQQTTWRWSGQEDGFAVVVLPDGVAARLRVSATDGATTSPFLLHDGIDELVRWNGPGSCTMVWLPRRALTDLAGTDIELPRVLSEGLLARGLRALLGTLSASAPPEAGTVSAYLLERLLIEHVWGLVLESAGMPRTAYRRGSLYERAHALIRLNAADAHYGVASLVHDMAISERHLQRLFAEHGATPRGALRRARVDVASSMLGNPDYDVLSLDQIARSAGFADGGSMRSAFLREGMPTPRRSRAARRNPGEPATVQVAPDHGAVIERPGG
ncbi:helix-turn-helix domain-containing protein [Microbacterium sp. No. 7]|uniref:helix-turn-helix domain-containing protein n=1 Tax=Microbacterium sp. No. 7 TaxID=1714373 RepID=UPI0006D138F9|nr:helix-turn-helix domain-containing protein [Microbacterium sp. No. 7]ALJ19975.1 hypothetical protein AOA12_08655 [Microbacterium sp. No. 7]